VQKQDIIMTTILPPSLEPLNPSSNMGTTTDSEATPQMEFFNTPKGLEKRKVSLDYIQLLSDSQSDSKAYVQTILDNTPKPKGRDAFTSIHIVGPNECVSNSQAEKTIQTVQDGSKALKREVHLHRLNVSGCQLKTTPIEEYNAIFEAASSLLLTKADRASLLVFVGWDNIVMDSYAAFIGMLPFRGIQVALISQRKSYGDMLQFTTPSGTFDLEGLCAARMGKFTVHTMFGDLPTKNVNEAVKQWQPVDITTAKEEANTVELPFKIGGLTLPMLTHNGTCEEALKSLSNMLDEKYPKGYTPIVSCGETCDALGYGQDLLDALDQEDGMLFSHKSGETYKRYDQYGSKELFDLINRAKRSTAPAVILAVGGGVNGNCIGLIAAMTNSNFIEVPTTPMHYNDAVTSAKKAFSLVVDDNILSKNIMGAFYLPQLAFCVNEWLLTISSASVHSCVGEATKTMNMLGIANSQVGANDFHNILGGVEFASDFTKILFEVGGFDNLIEFIEDPMVAKQKNRIINLGKRIAALRDVMKSESGSTTKQGGKTTVVGKLSGFPTTASMPSMASLASTVSSSSDSMTSDSDSESDHEEDMQSLIQERKALMHTFRSTFYKLPDEQRNLILSFLTTINREIICAKAMFLAYSDPFEKFRALLFEYAHTLGHGVEAFVNGLYLKARNAGMVVPADALRLHGQCVGMAVLWAGEMSKDLGKLTGEGYILHQSFPYLFNRSEGFSFHPIRRLCDELGVGKEEFCEQVLQVVRRDNKRGYCNSNDPKKSVDQLVTSRPGKMLASPDPNAEVRYLVEVDEEWQRDVLAKAFDGTFDNVADLHDGKLAFVPSSRNQQRTKSELRSSSVEVAAHIRKGLLAAYIADQQ
jgi:3-dehydroquinate synthetase